MSCPSRGRKEGRTYSLVSIGGRGEAVPYGGHKVGHGVLQSEDHGIGARVKCVRHLEPKCVSSRLLGTLSSDPPPAGEPCVSQSSKGPRQSHQGVVSTKHPGVSHLCLERGNRLPGCKLGKTERHRTNQNRWVELGPVSMVPRPQPGGSGNLFLHLCLSLGTHNPVVCPRYSRRPTSPAASPVCLQHPTPHAPSPSSARGGC